MRRRKTGYVLLALLVVTGLAGTYSGTISSKERKWVTNLFKEGKEATLAGFGDPGGSRSVTAASFPDPSVRSLELLHLVQSERELWNLLESTLRSPANADKRPNIHLTDSQVLDLAESGRYEWNPAGSETSRSPELSTEEVLAHYKQLRNSHITYLRATTEDLRNHLLPMSFGWIDSYQLCLLIAGHNLYHARHPGQGLARAAR